MERNEGDIFIVFFHLKFLKVPSDCSLGDPFRTQSSYCLQRTSISLTKSKAIETAVYFWSVFFYFSSGIFTFSNSKMHTFDLPIVKCVP